ncbi:HD domain-containing protein [Amycolatopsis balhimycina]|uniref:HD domain-containing protein n=1 Tax=Amycolatopsis balhimycina TaxID=208443 RepID=UPI00039DA619|nr:ATP-binding protein [Amycolatopsis balhimycina]
MELWDILRGGGDAQLTADVEYLVDYAAGKLILARDTFPDYTLHDRRHADNVIGLMEKLLGPDIESVTLLEAAMLILAAYFHDIGMVYSREEVRELLEEQDFKDYLDEHPSAFVRVAQSDEVPGDIVVDYCRARHADRVSEHLYRLEPGKLAWQSVSLVEALATVCKSHNEPLDELRSDRFETDFLDGCDLRLCAILLRAADLLDFDETRSPTAVYEHLRLDDAEGSRKVSRTEWANHMAARGFVFPRDRSPGYAVKLIASPDQPAVENAIRKFLDLVEHELRGCRVLLDSCHPRWRSLNFPGNVDRRGIVSQGYLWGDYRFVLDRHAVLQLFMGDRLYANPYVFIRELLQNAIDACRLNVYLHDADPESMEVHISAWEDESGNYWFRVDDTGVGMDRHIIENYFLGVGRSYYSSDDLQAEILRKGNKSRKFMSISRFGIGVLSTFIVGDHVEVSTRRRDPDGRAGVRLRMSLNSLDDFFVLRSHPMSVPAFPGRDEHESDYRKKCGTSVAVRINPAKSDVALDKLLQYAKDSLFYPPAKIFINGIEWREREYPDLSWPLLDGPVSHIVSDRAFADVESGADLLKTTEIQLTFLPLDLTRNSPLQQLRGQVLAVSVDVYPAISNRQSSLLAALPRELIDELPSQLAARLERCIKSRESVCRKRSFGQLDLMVLLHCETTVIKELRVWLNARHLKGDLSFDSLFSRTLGLEGILDREANLPPTVSLGRIYTLYWLDLLDGRAARHVAEEWLGHNGVRVSVKLEAGPGGPHSAASLAGGLLYGPVCLFDRLRPDVSVARDSLRDISYAIRSALHLALRRAAAGYGDSEFRGAIEGLSTDIGFPEFKLRSVTSAQITDDDLFWEWMKEKTINPGGKGLSMDDLCARAAKKELWQPLRATGLWSIEHSGDARSAMNFYDVLRVAMLESRLDLRLRILEPDGEFPYGELRASHPKKDIRPAGLDHLPPFFAVRYDDVDVVICSNLPANLANPLIAWLVEQWEVLGVRVYPAIFLRIRHALAIVANLRMFTVGTVADGEASRAADQVNSALDKLRRSMANPPEILAAQVYASSKYSLRLRQ